jgi:hypothetical protein
MKESDKGQESLRSSEAEGEGISAFEKRARDNEWTEVDVRIRKEMAAIVRTVLNHYRQHRPHQAHFFASSALMQMMQAIGDCRQLDLFKAASGCEPLYLPSLEFNTQGALAGIHCRAMAEIRAFQGSKKPRFAAIKVGDSDGAQRKTILEVIREKIRDGWDVGFVLKVNADAIQGMVDAGDAKFFEELGEVLRGHRRKPLQRGLTEWIVRAWLPLCLWECEPDGREAHWRFSEAAKLIGLDFEGADPAVFYLEFMTAWKNVRSKAMKIPRYS